MKFTLICGTNRPNNESQKFVKLYKSLLKERGYDCEEIYLHELPADFAFANDIISESSAEFKKVIDEKFIPAHKLIIVSPEYNGSFPGILKAFFDGISPAHFKNKRAALVGVAAGRSGNQRGMDQLTSVLHYLGSGVVSTKISFPQINGMMENGNLIIDDKMKTRIFRQIDLLIS